MSHTNHKANVGLDELKSMIKSEANVLKVSFKQQPKPNLENWRDVAQACKISHTKVCQQPPVCIQFVNKNGDLAQFATFGNFSVIIGRAKSRKTFSICLYLAAAIKKDSSGDMIRASLPTGKQKIILVDTEQSPYDVSRGSNRILKMAEVKDPENFEVFSLRALPPADRLFLVEQLIYDSDDLGILVIDGVRDLITDINSPEEATMISSRLLKWTQERHIHVIVVIHQNKGDNNARGHVGSELINKSESVISVEKDKDISIVKPEFSRGKDFEPFAFLINDAGMPEIIEDWTPGSGSNVKQKLTAYQVDKATHLKALKELFKDSSQKKYKELESDLKVIFQSYQVNLTGAQVVEFISYYKMNNMLENTGGKGRAGNSYFLPKTIALF